MDVNERLEYLDREYLSQTLMYHDVDIHASISCKDRQHLTMPVYETKPIMP